MHIEILIKGDDEAEARALKQDLLRLLEKHEVDLMWRTGNDKSPRGLEWTYKPKAEERL